MRNVDWDEIGSLALIAILIVVLVGLVVAGAVYVTIGIGQRQARFECGETGGKVDYYDKDHNELWRCVRPERAP